MTTQGDLFGSSSPKASKGRSRKWAGGKLIEGDCLEKMQDLDDNSIDMVLCDLPYGTTKNKWDSVIPLDELWKQWKRVCKPEAAFALFSHEGFTAELITSNKSWFQYKLVWMKGRVTRFLDARRKPLSVYEDICVFYGKTPKYRPVMSEGNDGYKVKANPSKRSTTNYNQFEHRGTVNHGERFPTNILRCVPRDLGDHPTQKPVALARWLVRSYTDEGDVVLDNCFGSGALLVGAALERRRFVGIEKNEGVKHRSKKGTVDCMKVARKRLKEAKEIVEAGGPFAEPRRRQTDGSKLVTDVDTVIGW